MVSWRMKWERWSTIYVLVKYYRVNWLLVFLLTILFLFALLQVYLEYEYIIYNTMVFNLGVAKTFRGGQGQRHESEIW